MCFFLSDSDHDKTIFNYKSSFQNLKMELILGHYFFVGYEDALKEIFSVIHEADEYQELIRTSASVVTSSVQTALEAKMSGAKVIFLEKEKLSNCDNTLLESINISIVYNFNLKQLENVITSMFPKYT